MVVDTSLLDINYPAYTQPHPCNRLPDGPCADTWTSREYDSAAWFGNVTMNACQQCGVDASQVGPPKPAATEEMSSFQQLRLCLHKNNSVCSLTGHILIEHSSLGSVYRGVGTVHQGLTLPEGHTATILGNGFSLDGQNKYQIIRASPGTLNVYETVFKNGLCTEDGYGGAVQIEARGNPGFKFSCFTCQFLNNNVEAQGMGGALYASQIPVHLENVLFRGNGAKGNYGRGAAVYVRGPFYGKNCQFIDNDSKDHGGAINFHMRRFQVPLSQGGWEWGTGKPYTYKEFFSMDPVGNDHRVELVNVHFSGSSHEDIRDTLDTWRGQSPFGGASATTTCPGASTAFGDSGCFVETVHHDKCSAAAVNCESYDLDSSWVQA